MIGFVLARVFLRHRGRPSRAVPDTSLPLQILATGHAHNRGQCVRGNPSAQATRRSSCSHRRDCSLHDGAVPRLSPYTLSALAIIHVLNTSSSCFASCHCRCVEWLCRSFPRTAFGPARKRQPLSILSVAGPASRLMCRDDKRCRGHLVGDGCGRATKEEVIADSPHGRRLT